MNFGDKYYKSETKSFCEVCGDKARGCNFDAITCASCKEFFRRNAFKQNGLKCYFQNNCTIDVISRRFCASCRLRKCLRAGMKKEYIMNEEQRFARKVKIIEKKQIKDTRKSGSIYKQQMSQQLDQMMNSDQHFHQSMVQMMTSEEVLSPASPSIANSGLESPNLPIGSVDDSGLFGFEYKPKLSPNVESILLDNKISNVKLEEKSCDQNMSSIESITKLLNKVKIIRESNYYPTKFGLLCRAQNMEKELNPKDKSKLKHLTSNIQLMQAETIHELPCSGRFIDVLKITEIITFMLIKMCKKLKAFQDLSQSDQIAVVKGGCMETLILRSIMTINMEKECWESMDLERNCKFSLKMEVLKMVNQKVYDAHRRYALSFEPEWRFDDNVMSLLIAIVIFSPERPNLSAVEDIRTEQQCYISLLKRYLSTVYDDTIADTTFYKLMDQLKLTKTISEIHVKAYFDVNTSQIEETGIGRLLMEILDLNSRNADKDN